MGLFGGTGNIGLVGKREPSIEMIRMSAMERAENSYVYE